MQRPDQSSWWEMAVPDTSAWWTVHRSAAYDTSIQDGSGILCTEMLHLALRSGVP